MTDSSAREGLVSYLHTLYGMSPDSVLVKRMEALAKSKDIALDEWKY